jgi:large subunit ribosomal protein L22
MADKTYNFQKKVNEKKIAKSCKNNAPISTKYAVEFSNYFKGKPLVKAITICDNIMEKKEFLPLLKYRKKVAHRKGASPRKVPSGRWPVKTAKSVKALLEDVRANAENLNLDTEKLKIIHMFAVKGVTRRKTQPLGRVGGKQRESKSTNIEVIVLEE